MRSGRARPIPSALASARGAVPSLAPRLALAPIRSRFLPPLPPPPSSTQVLRVRHERDGPRAFLPPRGGVRGRVSVPQGGAVHPLDFAQFPDKFIELLDACIASRGGRTRAFLAVLRVGADGERTSTRSLGVVETNKFKHLSHCCRSASTGDPSSIKPYLAARLRTSRASATARRLPPRRGSSLPPRGEVELACRRDAVAARARRASRGQRRMRATRDELAARPQDEGDGGAREHQDADGGRARAAETRDARHDRVADVAQRRVRPRARELDAATGTSADSRTKTDASSRLTAAEGELATATGGAQVPAQGEQGSGQGVERAREEHGAERDARGVARVATKDKEELCKVLKGRLERRVQ